jgi:hypothetical protein
MSTAIDQSVSDILRGIVQDKINQGEMFTALDISRESQWKNDVHERHDNMKSIVHEMFHNGEMPGYDRTLINIPTIPQSVWCYYSPLTDPSDYKSRWIGVKPGGEPKDDSQAIVTSVPALSFNNEDGNAPDDHDITPVAQPAYPAGHPNNQGDYERDKRGRLWVSKPLIAQLNVKTGDILYVVVEPNQIKISPTNPVNPDQRMYQVDKNGNIAISKINFDQSGINTNKVDVVVAGDELVIKIP